MLKTKPQTGDQLAERLQGTLVEIADSAAARQADVLERLVELERENAVLNNVQRQVAGVTA